MAERSQETRRQIVDATISTLRDEGFAGASARAIARRGGFNQALIFYHFGSVPDLLVTTLEQLASDRLDEYRAALDGVSDLGQAVSIARVQYDRDVALGHISVLTELVAGASAMPGLGPEVVRCMDPWIAFASESIERLTRGSLLARFVPPRDAALALIALYVGIEMLDHLDPAAHASRRLFDVGAGLTEALAPVLSGNRRRGTSRPQHVAIS